MIRKPNMISHITIDLVPYSVERRKKELVVIGCGGSILAKLDNSEERTNWKGSSDYRFAEIDGKWFEVAFDHDTGNCHFIGSRLTINHLVRWIADRFDAIESVGWEVLSLA